VTFSYYKYY